ncbi:MAG TPA: isocitrate lyase/phosphoenolpyruvate mutase family protein [Dyella sp.]|uniref:isocitrate lyase/PEP mutase family protein n=1 Tax=Dyella sp. TaxID=1869338 RepID=UPI002D76DD0B|nr:isocitrate lyase/phosphoenolpyruvate mutase family protein [Dyella sp.]HET6555281.1 isocitrate lyase/phosphoenolpyruvate mutase family protein [Dyella sp.]
MNSSQQARAEAFRQLHDAAEPLVLTNVWDVASARIVESGGARAIGTTSAGMAWSLGYADGEQLPVAELLDACRRICRAVAVPVTVDIEHGYGRDANETGALVDALIQLGVVGINIEDGIAPESGELRAASDLVERIAAARAVARDHDLSFFINARIDTYIALASGEARFAETLKRALVYVDAGADGIFVPGLADPAEIAQLAQQLPVPLNAYVGYAGAPSVSTLRQLGVRRISLGCGPMQATMAHLARIAREALEEGRYDTMADHLMSVSEANNLFPRHERIVADALA